MLILDWRERAKNALKLSPKYLVHEIGAKLVSNWGQTCYITKLANVL